MIKELEKFKKTCELEVRIGDFVFRAVKANILDEEILINEPHWKCLELKDNCDGSTLAPIASFIYVGSQDAVFEYLSNRLESKSYILEGLFKDVIGGNYFVDLGNEYDEQRRTQNYKNASVFEKESYTKIVKKEIFSRTAGLRTFSLNSVEKEKFGNINEIVDHEIKKELKKQAKNKNVFISRISKTLSPGTYEEGDLFEIIKKCNQHKITVSITPKRELNIGIEVINTNLTDLELISCIGAHLGISLNKKEYELLAKINIYQSLSEMVKEWNKNKISPSMLENKIGLTKVMKMCNLMKLVLDLKNKKPKKRK